VPQMGAGEGEWDHVAAAVRHVLNGLAVSKTGLARAAKVDFRTVDRMLKAQPVQHAQLSKLALYVGWDGDAFDAIRKGEPPPPVRRSEASPDDRLSALEHRFDRMEAALRSRLGLEP
jgi:hypothetical protein